MTLEGKGYFIWKIRYCEGGDVNAIADMAHEAQFTHLLIKVADGSRSYNLHPETFVDLVPPLIEALRNRGISPWGWQYIYGYDPLAEANKAIERVNRLGLDGFVVNAEAEFKQPGMEKGASQYMRRLRAGLPNTPLALSSYRFPSFHSRLPWDEFLGLCDLAMPQVYWEQLHNPIQQLTRCVNEYRNLKYVRPIIPTGSAYKRGKWESTPEDVFDFLTHAQQLNLRGANFWVWSHTRRYLPDTWDAIRDYCWQEPSEVDFSSRYIDALNSHDPEQVASLYADNAVHVNSQRTIQGRPAIVDWYKVFFREILPNAIFKLSDTIGSGRVRHLYWTASSSAGEVNMGSDTISLNAEQIIYHYTFYVVT